MRADLAASWKVGVTSAKPSSNTGPESCQWLPANHQLVGKICNSQVVGERLLEVPGCRQVTIVPKLVLSKLLLWSPVACTEGADLSVKTYLFTLRAVVKLEQGWHNVGKYYSRPLKKKKNTQKQNKSGAWDVKFKEMRCHLHNTVNYSVKKIWSCAEPFLSSVHALPGMCSFPSDK